MRLKFEFNVRQIAGEYILVPMGVAALEFSGMVTTNAVGALILEKLRQDTTPEQICQAICQEFEVDEATAREDMEQFLAVVEKAGLLEK
ncbi:MAG: PqqD family protein [Oscillospiraceae bacterium]|nr:PqqD family protein [Oscillospiraceae bacterium]